MKLFPPGIEPDDPILKRILPDPRYREDIQFLESIWCFYEPYADANFSIEIKKHFHARFWEMYLAYSLAELGFQLVPPESNRRPDICVLLDDKNVWIEATVPSAGSGDDAVPQLDLLEDTLEFVVVPEEKIVNISRAIPFVRA